MKETLTDLKERRSVRSYEPRQISNDELNAVLEAGTWAPTGAGSQSPVIVCIQDADLIAKIEKMNAAAFGHPEAHTFYGAPTLLIVFVDKTAPTPIEDGSLVLGNLLNAAQAVGLGSCWIHRAREFSESDEGKAMMANWGLDADKYVGVGNCILGYAAAATPAPAPRKEGYVIKVG
ncbi:MAG: nitroreductase [Coriobacteriales bacterium]|nr:nitroreductase [Coriobacteriales bacterium]